MASPRLHPRLQALLEEQGWAGLTGAQEAALDPLLEGRHVLLVAPTGHGKTEAALIPVLSQILHARDRGKLDAGFLALYVTPLRALNRDLLGRLESWGEALGITVGVRHGDTSQAERARQSRRPPQLLITTPETVQLLLYGERLRSHLASVRAVIVDEVHDLAASERGAQLMVAVERIEDVVRGGGASHAALGLDEGAGTTPSARAGEAARSGDSPNAGKVPEGFQRIGLSATVADPGAVARFLGGRRNVEAVVVDAFKELRLAVRLPAPGDPVRAAELNLPPEALGELEAIRAIVAEHARVLVFQNTRDGAELTVSRSAALDAGDPLLGLHHGSLSPTHREEVERAFKEGSLRGLVATSSMELGIDVGAVDHVVQVHSPRSIARFVQRLGRAGHRVGAVSEGTLLARGPEDVLECMAVAARAMRGALEPLRIRQEPLVVLCNQIVAMSNEGSELDPAETYALLCRAGPFLELEEGLFQAVWETLLDVQTLFPSDDAPQRIGRSGRGRRHFLQHISLIPDDKTYRIVDEASKRSIGAVDDAYVAASLHPGAVFVMAGRSWQVAEIDSDAAKVRVAPAKDLGAVPQWTGAQLPVSFELAQEVGALRGHFARQASPPAGFEADSEAVAEARRPIIEHVEAGLAVPTDKVVTLEKKRGALTINAALGTRGTEALGRITQVLLHQRFGAPVGLQTDAYRIHLDLPAEASSREVEELWASLDPETLDALMALVLRDSPSIRHQLVQVAKQFGALPESLDPNRFSRAKLEALLNHLAIHEETVARLVHERFDLDAVAMFLRGIQAGDWSLVVQGEGPISRLGREEASRGMTLPRTDAKLLQAVRDRIELSEVLLACCACGRSWPGVVGELPTKIRCRACSSTQVACLRPWNEDQVPLLRRDRASLTKDERLEADRMRRNGSLVTSFGTTACRCLVARGIGPDTAVRILQKVADPEDARFWREILQADLTFARTNAFWRR